MAPYVFMRAAILRCVDNPELLALPKWAASVVSGGKPGAGKARPVKPAARARGR